MRVLVGCEVSRTVRDAFIRRGHDAWSCDLLPSTGPHYQCDLRDVLGEGWDLLIAHPPCTYLSSSGLHWNARKPTRKRKTEDALAFVRLLLDSPIGMVAIENPVGCIGTRIRPADQIIQPYEFGDDASKKTCLWLENLPPLRKTIYVPPRIVAGRPRWSNQDDYGQNNASGSLQRQSDRSRTYPGIAEAMADQWGSLLDMAA